MNARNIANLSLFTSFVVGVLAGSGKESISHIKKCLSYGGWVGLGSTADFIGLLREAGFEVDRVGRASYVSMPPEWAGR